MSAERRAEGFWRRAGGPPASFPRDIERPVALALPIAIVRLPRVTVGSVATWLRLRGREIAVPGSSQELAGCVVAHCGRALVFVCGADPEDEVRITIAHETAHVIVHYLEPREAAIRAAGPNVAEVLDGVREATVEERVAAVIASVRLGPHVHLLMRGADARRIAAVSVAEEEADELALELLAPRQEVKRLLRNFRRNGSVGTPAARRAALAQHFGVPAEWFESLSPDESGPGPATFTDHLFSPLRRLS